MASLEQLVMRIKRGDREAFDDLCRETYGTLISYARMFLSSVWAEDVVQDVLFGLWKHRESIVGEGGGNIKGYLLTEGTTETFFVGSSESVKVAVGDKEGNVYKTVWSEGDQIYIIDATKAGMNVLGTAELVSGAGETNGTFSTKAELTDGAKVKIAYGITNIPAEQTQNASGAKVLTDITGAMSEEITLSLGGTNGFTLVHTPAIVKVNVSTSDFAGMNLESVMLYSKGAKLSGDGQTTGDYVCVTFKNPAASDKVQEAWFTTLPVAEPTDFYAVATFKGTYNSIPGTTVTIPVKFTGKTLAGNKVTSIPMTDLTLDSNTEASWYEPVETRYFKKDEYAYGNENTTYAKFPKVENGAETKLKISVKAKGRFNKVEKPLTAKTIFGQENGKNMCRVNASGAKVYTIADCGAVPVNAYLEDASGNKGGLGQWAIYGEDGSTILWTFNLWMGVDDPAEIALVNGTVLDRNLGAHYAVTTQNDWKSNGCYFQWGRFTFNGWGGNFHSIIDTDVYDISQSIRHAPKEILNAYGVTGSHGNDWLLSTKRDDLWAEPSTGNKSVYDPCPKGYKVINKAIVDELAKAVEGKTATIDKSGNIYYISYMNSTWNLSGGFNAATSAKVGRSGNNNVRNGWYWASGISNNDAYCLYFDLEKIGDYTSGKSKIQKNRPRSSSYSVRCMKDTDNR